MRVLRRSCASLLVAGILAGAPVVATAAAPLPAVDVTPTHALAQHSLSAPTWLCIFRRSCRT